MDILWAQHHETSAMTEAELSEALKAASRAGDAKAKEFLRMWYDRRATITAVQRDTESVEDSVTTGNFSCPY